VFAVILEKIVFGTTPPLLSIFGIVIIIAAALWVAVRPAIVDNPHYSVLPSVHKRKNPKH
jgi:hypothetical protein